MKVLTFLGFVCAMIAVVLMAFIVFLQAVGEPYYVVFAVFIILLIASVIGLSAILVRHKFALADKENLDRVRQYCVTVSCITLLQMVIATVSVSFGYSAVGLCALAIGYIYYFGKKMIF